MKIYHRFKCFLPMVIAMGVSLPAHGRDAVRNGEAVVAGQVGSAKARIFTGPVHEGKTKLIDLSEGVSVGESSRLITARDGRLCVVLSPGAILCVAPETELTMKQLRHTATGLPETEEDLVRRIHIELHKGRILVHAAAPSPSLDIQVDVDAGTIKAEGGTFVVAQTGKGEWAVISEEYDLNIAPHNGDLYALGQGKGATLKLVSENKAEVTDNAELLDSSMRQFEICNAYFQDLETFIHDPIYFDRVGLGQYVGSGSGIEYLGAAVAVSDVSPSFRPVTVATIRPPLPAGPGAMGGGRWDQRRIWAWYDQVGVVKGVNYVPRNAVNSTEMWMEETFDADIIEEELGWAQDSGYTAVRIQLQYVVWKNDPTGFVDRVNQFLDIARKKDLRVVPVLFDDLNLAGKEPEVGPQPEPIPGEFNARWTPSPGAALVKDRNAWPDLESYVKTIVKELKSDDRVLYWDLYNTAGNSELWEESLPLIDQSFNWVREVDPKQPIAVAAWTKFGSAMSARKLERSDIITFQSFDSVDQVQALILLLKRYDRPIICANWLMRQQYNNFEKILPVFSANRIGWFNHGLVNGKTQTWIQQAQFKSKQDPDRWQGDILKSDGDPYDSSEIEQIKAFRFLEGP